MTSLPRVSVAMATYQGAPYLEAQLRSIISQTHPVDEIVVADDGSGDNTLDLAREILAGSDARVVILEGEPRRLGVAANFERALHACTGEVVVLADQDDVWVPNRVERLLAEFAADDGCVLVASDARLVDSAGLPIGGTLFGALPVRSTELAALASPGAFDLLLRRNLLTGATMAVRPALLRSALPIPAPWIHDEWLAIAAAATGRIRVLSDPLIDYRQHGSNQIGVSASTLGRKLQRVLEPGSTRTARLVAMSESLVAWLNRCSGAPADRMAAVVGKLAHERARAALPRARWRRIRPVLRQAAAGGYRRFSSQRDLDALRDLLQPLDGPPPLG